MMAFTELALSASDPPEPFTDRLRLAVAVYLARFKGSRKHAESDLRCYMSWCAERGLDPAGRLAAASRAAHPVDAGGPPVQAAQARQAGFGRVLARATTPNASGPALQAFG